MLSFVIIAIGSDIAAIISAVCSASSNSSAAGTTRDAKPMLMRPPSSAFIAIWKPSPSFPTRLAAGTRQFENHRRGRLAVPAEFLLLLPEEQSRLALFDDD